MNTKDLAKRIVLEASGDDHIKELVEQAIESSLKEVSFETLKSNFDQAKTQYYGALKGYLADKLGVDVSEIGRFITADMKKSFADALQKNYEALQPTQDKVKDYSDPQLIVEN